MYTFETLILMAFADHGGGAWNADIYREIEASGKLTPNHYHIEYRVPKFRHQLRAHMSNLVKKGELCKIAEGLHEITERGYRRLEG